jgi:hypothetical protein
MKIEEKCGTEAQTTGGEKLVNGLYYSWYCSSKMLSKRLNHAR